MAHAQALQYWTEGANLPKPGKPHLLVGFILELQKMMKQYILFSEDIVFGSVALPEGFFGSKISVSTDVLPAPSNVPPEEVASPIGRPPKESTTPQVPCEKQVKMEAPPN